MSDNFHKGSTRDEKLYYEDTPNDGDSDSPDSRLEGKDSENKSKKKYSVISQSIREKFIKRVLSKEVTIKEAAKEFGLKFSTSKAILQTYKKEGRIGKKKNRERKTKVVNVVFVCNINPVNPYHSNIFPLVSVNEIKGAKASSNAEENKNKLVEQALTTYPDHKIVHQTNLQIPNDSNKSTQQFIKELGNDFLKDYIDKHFHNKLSTASSISSSLNSLPGTNPPSNVPSTQSVSMGNPSNMSNILNLNNYSNLQPPHLNGMSNMGGMGGASYGISQSYSMSTEMMPQPTGLGHYGQLNQPSPNQITSNLQKRSFQTYEKDTIPELDLKNEQITEMSVKKFKSGEDLWDYDMDKSKKDLEDFIYKTHHAIKNNSYIGKTSTFDFSKYREDFNE